MSRIRHTSTPPACTPIKPEVDALHLSHKPIQTVSSASSDQYRDSVLAVDDDAAMLSSISRILRRSKIRVRVATSGSSALKQLGLWLPALVLLDVSMPGMSGQAFLRRFRQAEMRIHQTRQIQAVPIPVVFVTAQAGHHQRIDGLNAGAVDYLIKPFDPQEFRARVCSQLRHYRRTQESILQAASNPNSSASGAAA